MDGANPLKTAARVIFQRDHVRLGEREVSTVDGAMDDQLFDKLNKSHYGGGKKDEVDQGELERQNQAVEEVRRYFTDILERNASRQVEVRSIVVDGGGGRNTRDAFLNRQLEPIFEAKSVSSLIRAIDEVHENLAGLGIYEKIVFSLDDNGRFEHSHSNPFSGLFGDNRFDASSSKIDINGRLNLTQAKRFYAKTGTDLGNGEGNGYANMTFKNIFGGAEILSFDATIGTRTRSSYIVNYNTPVLSVLPPNWRSETLAFMTSRSIPWASNEQIVRGISTKIKSLPSRTASSLVAQQELGFEAVWRTIASTSGASASIRNEVGNSLKASIFHSLAYDTRDNILMAKSGNYFKFAHELAGIGGIGNAFYKTSFESQHNWSFGKTSLHFGTKSGLLFMLTRPSSGSSSPPPSNIMDRFYLGGPNDVRGFYPSGIGARDQSDSLGGEALLATGLSLLTPIPKVNPDTPLRFHTFINAGNLLPLDTVSTTARQLISSPSISSGFGLLYCHSVARFELNITFPLIARQNEATRKGLQFGVGLSFL